MLHNLAHPRAQRVSAYALGSWCAPRPEHGNVECVGAQHPSGERNTPEDGGRDVTEELMLGHALRVGVHRREQLGLNRVGLVRAYPTDAPERDLEVGRAKA